MVMTTIKNQPQQSLSDAQLLHLIQSSEHEKWQAVLYLRDEHKPKVIRRLKKYLNGSNSRTDEIWDKAQDCFLEKAQKAGFSLNSTIQGYLYVCCKNIIINEKRHSGWDREQDTTTRQVVAILIKSPAGIALLVNSVGLHGALVLAVWLGCTGNNGYIAEKFGYKSPACAKVIRQRYYRKLMASLKTQSECFFKILFPSG